jgi:HTH DNA binding domain
MSRTTLARRASPRRPRSARGADRSRFPSLVEVRFAPRRGGHLVSELLRHEGAEARLVACRLVERPSRYLLRWLDISVPAERRDRLLAALGRRDHDLVVAPIGPTRLLLRLRDRAPPACLATHRAGGLCVSCPLVGHGDGDGWRVVVPRGPTTDRLLRALPSGGTGGSRIARMGPYRAAATLTPRQERALRVAFELGYFGYPRRGTLGDVARALGAGRSTTLEVLRRATGKLARERYRNGLGARPLE